MRKLDIIESNIEPDKNNIWLKDGKLLSFQNGKFVDTASRDSVDDLLNSYESILNTVTTISYFNGRACVKLYETDLASSRQEILISSQRLLPIDDTPIFADSAKEQQKTRNIINYMRDMHNIIFINFIILKEQSQYNSLKDIVENDYKNIINFFLGTFSKEDYSSSTYIAKNSPWGRAEDINIGNNRILNLEYSTDTPSNSFGKITCKVSTKS